MSKAIELLTNSFLQPLLQNEYITDISYNGRNIFYQDNRVGRVQSDIKITNEEASNFIRQIANVTEKQFSVSSPYLDTTILNYRIHAVHSSIGRVKDNKTITFDIRISSSKIRLDNNFFDDESKNILLKAIKEKKSILIAGPTGCGKTELQKYLISHLEPNTRIIIIDNVQELDFLITNESLDSTYWLINESNKYTSINELIKNALRSNPDWIVVAEARGEEMALIILSVETGHPIISTIHANTLTAIPHRVARMIMMSDANQKYEDIYDDVINNFDYFVFCNRCVNNEKKVERFIESIGIKGRNDEIETIYFRKDSKNAN